MSEWSCARSLALLVETSVLFWAVRPVDYGRQSPWGLIIRAVDYKSLCHVDCYSDRNGKQKSQSSTVLRARNMDMDRKGDGRDLDIKEGDLMTWIGGGESGRHKHGEDG
jgi:hypothetical protein